MIATVVLAAWTSAQSPLPVVRVEPSVVPDGSPVLVVVCAPGRIEGRFENQPLRFRGDTQASTAALDRPRQTALAAIPYAAKPGPREVVVRITHAGQTQIHHAPFTVVSGNYPTSIVVTPPRSKATLIAAGAEPHRKNAPPLPRAEPGSFSRALASNTKARLWRGRFLRPVITTVTEPYGTSRLNIRGRRKWRSTHLALDLDGQGGEPVLASNGGVVVAAGHYPGSGNTVIIDHGDRLLSLHFHNDRLHVKRGDRVKRGTAIADVGATGRVTGPHLHLEIRLNGHRVSPESLIDLIPPEK
ncbi:MAG: M23 family metallopeptidase [Deltaproteobacteria bacterium]|nr:M23 family metallopeptidase [Deltaproteobacteria bacterium]